MMFGLVSFNFVVGFVTNQSLNNVNWVVYNIERFLYVLTTAFE